MKTAVFDIVASHRSWRLVGMLGWQDLKHRYRRSLLGPFWLTVSMAVQIGMISLVFGSVLKVPMSQYVPYITIGLVLWQFIVATITSSCSSFVSSAALIKQVAVPMFVYVARDVWRELVTLAHNFLIIPLVFVLFGRGVGWSALLAVAGFFVVMANVGWIVLVLAVLSTRYRDLPQTVSSVLPTLMFVTPIIWMPSMMPGRFGSAFVAYNPLARLVELVRGPLLGEVPPATIWTVSLAVALVGWALALYLFSRGRRRIVFWL